mmetsp:Transcript_948/g.582  ORF Transcript_948/g.582 Transcript_948/m.582 type:complete len:84 (-) Transcript_948:29-280(-)
MEVLDYKQLFKHEKNCPFEKIHCPAFKDCGCELFRQDLEKHMRECSHIKVACSKCYKQVARRKMALHDREDCPLTLVECCAAS